MAIRYIFFRRLALGLKATLTTCEDQKFTKQRKLQERP